MEYQFSDVCLLGGCTSVAMDSESKQRLSSKSTTLTNAVRWWTIVKIFNSISHKISKYSTFSSQKILLIQRGSKKEIQPFERSQCMLHYVGFYQLG